MDKTLETATFGAGCFWCVEAVFQNLRGVHRVVSGYAGGDLPNPSYDEVCTGVTGHAEVIQIKYDPEMISFQDLLAVFWRTHDPTTLNRQGNDIGSQYRSIILYHHETQRKAAEKSLAETDASDLWPDAIVTEISPLDVFYEAEGYHHDYYRMNPTQPYCRYVIDPKLQKLKKEFSDKLKDDVAPA